MNAGYRAFIRGYLSFRGLPVPEFVPKQRQFYFHYLVPVDGSELEPTVDEWQGRLVAIKRIVQSEARKNAEGFKEQFAAFGEIKGLKARMNRLESAMEQILQKLDKIGPSSS